MDVVSRILLFYLLTTSTLNDIPSSPESVVGPWVASIGLGFLLLFTVTYAPAALGRNVPAFDRLVAIHGIGIGVLGAAHDCIFGIGMANGVDFILFIHGLKHYRTAAEGLLWLLLVLPVLYLVIFTIFLAICLKDRRKGGFFFGRLKDLVGRQSISSD